MLEHYTTKKTDRDHMMHQARVLECVHVHVDAMSVFLFMVVLVNVFANMAVEVDVFMLMFSNVLMNTIVTWPCSCSC